MPAFHRSTRHVAVAAALVAAAACAKNPVTGRTELALVSESQEIAMGQEAAPQIRASLGVVPNQALQTYVSTLGMTLARASERPNIPWSFAVVEDASVNAFALPGGPIFITRGILAHMNSEAQLVSVLGHEIGHITARHVVQQMSQSQLAQIGIIAAVLVKPELAQFGDIASTGLGLLFMKFGRDDETQSDQLGFRYMTTAGYNPQEMVAMFQTLERLGAGSGQGKTPEWLSTHPDPGNRVAATRTRIAQAGTLASATRIERDAFLRQLDGMVFGDNPRDGFFRGASFLHPDMKFQFEFPSGWSMQNQAAAVVGVSSQQDAIIGLTLAGNVTPSQGLSAFMSQQGMQNGGTSTSAINGLPAGLGTFTATMQDDSKVGGWVAFIQNEGQTLRLLGYTPAERLNAYSNTLRQSVTSFRRLTDPAALAVKPARVRLVRINSAMTIEDFNRTYPSTITIDKLALINGVTAGERIAAGTTLKWVTTDQ